MTTPGWQLLAQFGADRILNSIPQGLLIGTLAWLLLRICRKQNSGTRFAIRFSALLAVALLPFVSGLTTRATATQAARPEMVLPGFWAVAIFAGWALIAAVATARIAVGLWNLRQLRRSCVAIPASDLPPAVRDAVEEFKASRPVVICTSSTARVPTAIGFFEPLILVPEWALQELSAEDLKVILLHEFTHLRRWDDWTNLAQKVLRAIFFFQPAVWWIEKLLSLEREMACDELVLAKTENPRAYAECLVSLAEKSFVRRGLAMAQTLISHARETSLRLAQILDVDRRNGTRVFKPAMGMMAAFAALCLIVLPDAPTLISFENLAPPAFTSARNITPGLPKAGVVLATAPFDKDVVHEAGRRTSMLTLASDRSPRFTELVAVKEKQPQPHPARIVRASAKQVTRGPQLLVVMQATQYDGEGSAVLSFCVWQVTFATEDGIAVHESVIVKSI